MRHPETIGCSLLLVAGLVTAAPGVEPAALTPVTSLANAQVRYRVSKKPAARLRRGDVEAVIVNNQADDDLLSKHRAGYSGVGSLKHKQRADNVFVPSYAGLNFEHIHDGVVRDRKVLFEPRNAPMELRLVDEHTVELYQAPSPHYGLESCLRYQMLKDGALEMTLECIPRRKSFQNGYIGLFWASYIHQPESLDIHFKGIPSGKPSSKASWVRGVTPAHGVLSSHLSKADDRVLAHDENFPLTLVFNRSRYRYAEPWYYGLSHDMALVMLFRPKDQVRFAQSPSGGGKGNPAWDFQFFIPDYQVGRRYRMVMRALYTPFESPEQIERLTRKHRQALAN